MTPEERAKWLEIKRGTVSASEAAQVLEVNGKPLSEWGDAYQVYASKVLGYEVPDNLHMELGRIEEEGTALLYEHHTGRPVFDPGSTTIQRSAPHPFISATLDRMTEATQQYPAPDECCGPGVLELKNHHPQWWPYWIACDAEYKWDPRTRTNRLCYVPHRDPAEEWRLDPPVRYQVQLQIQIYCAGTQWGSLCGRFVGNEIAWVDYKRNDRFLDWAIPQLVEFWDRVERRDPPPVRLDRTIEVVKQCFPVDDGGTVFLDDDILSMALEWECIKGEMNDLDKRRKLLRAQVTAKMESNTWAPIGDRWLKYKMTKKGYRKLSIVRHKR
jgi:predicted phage-related endonuclease